MHGRWCGSLRRPKLRWMPWQLGVQLLARSPSSARTRLASSPTIWSSPTCFLPSGWSSEVRNSTSSCMHKLLSSVVTRNVNLWLRMIYELIMSLCSFTFFPGPSRHVKWWLYLGWCFRGRHHRGHRCRNEARRWLPNGTLWAVWLYWPGHPEAC